MSCWGGQHVATWGSSTTAFPGSPPRSRCDCGAIPVTAADEQAPTTEPRCPNGCVGPIETEAACIQCGASWVVVEPTTSDTAALVNVPGVCLIDDEQVTGDGGALDTYRALGLPGGEEGK